ncbi:unnamed protein product [Rhizoctonia solani]|uniref:DNA (cytosine-5-)-methyltransferase n=1 Tax=Rhizoctonia solani TaxID=456999 RepID=A0A8H3BHI3_9AGAM|nr:unnamed protein product [Rhizoctonia solani]
MELDWDTNIDWDEYLPEPQVIQSLDDIDLQAEHTDDNRRIFRLEDFVAFDIKTKERTVFDISNIDGLCIIGNAIPIFPDINDDDGRRSDYDGDDEDSGRKPTASDDNAAAFGTLMQLSAIQKADYTYLDVSAACCDGIYVLTGYAWYLLQRPAKVYAPFYERPFREFRLVLVILRRAYENPDERLSEFLPKFRRLAARIDRKYTKALEWGYRELHQMDLQQSSSVIAHHIQEFIDNLASELENTDDQMQRMLVRGVHDHLTRSRVVEKVLAGNLATIRRRSGEPDPALPLDSPTRTFTTTTPAGNEVIEIHDSSDEEMEDVDAPPRKSKVGRQTCVTPVVERAARKVFGHPLNLIGEKLPDVSWQESRGMGTVVRGDVRLRRGQCILVPAGVDQQEPHEDWLFNQNKAISVNKAANEYWFAQVLVSTGDDLLHVRWFDHSSKTVLLGGLERPMELFLSMRCGNIRRAHVKRMVEVQWLGPDQSVPDHERGYYVRFVRTLDNSFTWAEASDVQLDQSTRCKVCDLAQAKRTKFNNSTNTLTLQGLDLHRGDFLVTQPMSSSPWFAGVSIPHKYRNTYPAQIFQVVAAVRSDDPARSTLVGLVLQPYERVQELRRHGHLPEEYDACPGRTANDERRLCLMDPWNSLLEWDVLKEHPVRKCYVRHPDMFPTHDEMNAWLSKSPLHFVVDLQAVGIADQPLPAGRSELQDPILSSVQPLSLNVFQGIAKPCRRCPEELGGTRVTRMRMLDLFSGAGGLTQGLVLSGVCDPSYAIDRDGAALGTYKRNFPGTSAIHQDVNVALSETLVAALAGHDRAPMPDDEDDPEPLPGRHDVDFIAAGPPCQSFSGANRFKKDTDPRTTMIIAIFSAIDHYRPKYFAIENVPNALTSRILGPTARAGSTDSTETDFSEENYVEQGLLRFITRAALDLGYSVRMGVLQAAEYGAPQHRRRAFILGARHGFTLPELPLPTYCVRKPDTGLRLPTSRYIDPTHQKNGKVSIVGNAIHRQVTMWDAIGDLAPFEWVNPHLVVPQTEESRAEDRRRRNRPEGRIPTYIAVKDDRQPVGVGADGPAAYRGDSPYTAYQQEARGNENAVSEHYTSSFKSSLFVERSPHGS